MTTQPKKFEFFLESLMSHADAAAIPERVDLPRKAVAARDIEAEGIGFWAAPSLNYFEQRLELAGCDTTFDVAIAHQSGTRRHRFALSLWPDFELGVLAAPDGAVFYPHFVRRSGVIASLPADVGDILPWSATFEEVLCRFGPPLDASAWDLRRWVTYALGRERWEVTFDLGLVQNVTAGTIAPGILPGRNPGLGNILK